MNKRYFYPPFFLEILNELGESSINAIANKARCSESTAESNLKQLLDDCLAIRKWKYGMWMYRALTKKESYDKKWISQHKDQVRESNRKSAKKLRDRDPEAHRKKCKDWVKNNPEKMKESRRKWYDKNKDEYNKKRRKQYMSNYPIIITHNKSGKHGRSGLCIEIPADLRHEINLHMGDHLTISVSDDVMVITKDLKCRVCQNYTDQLSSRPIEADDGNFYHSLPHCTKCRDIPDFSRKR